MSEEQVDEEDDNPTSSSNGDRMSDDQVDDGIDVIDTSASSYKNVATSMSESRKCKSLSLGGVNMLRRSLERSSNEEDVDPTSDTVSSDGSDNLNDECEPEVSSPTGQAAILSPAALPQTSQWKEQRQLGKQLAARKRATHRIDQNLERSQTSQGDTLGKYDYLDKKDWDRLVIDEEDTTTAKDMRMHAAYKLSDLSKENENIPYQESDFDETQIDLDKAEEFIAGLLEQPTLQGFKNQKRKIKDDELKHKWVQFFKNVQKHVDIETQI